MNAKDWLFERISKFFLVLLGLFIFCAVLYLCLDLIVVAIGAVMLLLIAIWPFIIIALPVLAVYLLVSVGIEFVRYFSSKK